MKTQSTAPPITFSWLDQWSFFSGISPDKLSEADRASIQNRFGELLRPVPEKRLVQFARLYANPFLEMFSAEIRLKLTSAIKMVRNPTRKALVVEPENWELMQLHRRLQSEHQGTSRLWNGKKAVICLTHDVDNKVGYDFIPEMLRRQGALGLPGTFNFVTSYDYVMEPALLEKIKDAGFESGLHCLTHDIGLAYRGRKKITKDLTLALSRMPEVPRGFRSAALSISPELHEVIGELGLIYDSTMQISNPVYHSASWPFPFYLKESGIWEIPLTVQDDVFLRDASIEISVAVATLRKMLDAIVEVGGAFVIILHPHLMARNPDFYNDMLALFSSYQDKAWITTTGNAVDSVAKDYESRRHLLQ